MPIKLGEMLIKARLLTSEALDDALKSQVIFGGRLGTNLIEMGCIDEEELARILSEKLRVPYADPGELMEVSPAIVALISAELAEKHQFVPLRLDGRRLSVAMADPSDLAALDEIAFLTGYVIQPMVTPEIRLLAALEKYYGIRRELRFIPVSKSLGGRRTCSYTPRPTDPLVAPREVVDFSVIPGGEADYFSVEDEQAVRDAALERCSVDAVSRELVEARDRDAVAVTLVRWAAAVFGSAGLVIVGDNAVRGWEAAVGAERLDQFAGLRIGHDEPSVFQTVIKDGTVFAGAAPDVPANRRLLVALGAKEPQGIVLMPMLMKKRVVTILCATGPSDRLGERLAELRTVARKGVMAFEILILRNKILMT